MYKKCSICTLSLNAEVYEVCFDTDFEYTKEGYTSSGVFIHKNCKDRLLKSENMNMDTRQVELHNSPVLYLLPRVYHKGKYRSTSYIFTREPAKRASFVSSHKRKWKKEVTNVWLNYWTYHIFTDFFSELLHTLLQKEYLITYTSLITNMPHVRLSVITEGMHSYTLSQLASLGVDIPTLAQAFEQVCKYVTRSSNLEFFIQHVPYVIEHDVLSFFEEILR